MKDYLANRTAAAAVALSLIVIALVSIPLLTSARSPGKSTTGKISDCIDKYSSMSKFETNNLNPLFNINTFCYASFGSQLLVDEENIRKDNFVFQRQENTILLIMVVAITLSGVALAGLQLLASYKLAVIGKGELASGGEFSYSQDSISFKSSVVGLVILAISFAFFLVFVVDVYELKDEKDGSHPGASQSPTQGVYPGQAPGRIISASSNQKTPPPTAESPTVGPGPRN